MRIYLPFFFGIVIFLQANAQPETRIGVTRCFAFYSNPWINAHHFLYSKARNAKEKMLLEKEENEIFRRMTKEDSAVYLSAIKFYQEKIIKKDLLFDNELYAIKEALGKTTSTSLPDTSEFNIQLNKVAPLYQKYFWPLHHQFNQATYLKNIDVVEKIEDEVFAKLRKLAGKDLQAGNIKTDITAYADWAGAYTSTDPTHIVISSARDNAQDSYWIEILFHEASHELIDGWSGPVGETIDQVGKRLGTRPPRSLWHGVLFYLTGRTVTTSLEKLGIIHEMYMVRGKVFANLYPGLDKFYGKYFEGKMGLEEATEGFLKEYKP